MERKSLPEAELEVMLALWTANRPLTRGEIESALKAKGISWASTTVLSLLSRLRERGFVRDERLGQGKKATFEAAVQENDYLADENRTFLSRWYHNSVADLVATLHAQESLDEQDICELRKLLDELEEKS